jgi:hypothetical protein
LSVPNYKQDGDTVDSAADLEENTVDKRSLSSISRFGANWRLLAATQLFGESQKAGEIVASFLDLAPSAFRERWFGMEDLLAVKHENVTKDIIRRNLILALLNKTADKNGRKRLTVSPDMGWQRRGLAFNSISGHALFIDVVTGKVICKRVYSKQC